jgi:maltose alpha-D-glucosyltransferase/alpha-amylase
VEIPLGRFAGLTPVEMLGQTQLPRIGEAPYFLTLAPYGFYWFHLQESVVPVASRTAPIYDEHPAVPVLFAGVVWDAMFDGSMRTIVEKRALVPFLERQRWFAGKARAVAGARFVDWATLRRGAHPSFLTIVEVQYLDGERERYVLPLAMASGEHADLVEEQHGHAIVSRVTGARKGILYDGLYDDDTCSTLLAVMQHGREIGLRDGSVRSMRAGAALPHIEPATAPIRRGAPDQSNTSVMFGWQLILKLFRRVEPGTNPDVEIGGFLTARGFDRIPPLLDSLTYHHDGGVSSMAMLQPFIPNQGNAWQVTVETMGRYFEGASLGAAHEAEGSEARAWIASPDAQPPAHVLEEIGTYLSTAGVLGRRTGELHVALASDAQDPAFAPEFYTAEELKGTSSAMRAHAEEQLRFLEAALPSLDDRRQGLARELLAARDSLLHRFDALRDIRSRVRRIRCHGDYHLGQVLVTEGDVVILDFEGEPARPVGERRAKTSPLRDIAGMLRSFSYAALTGLDAVTQTRPDDIERLAPWAAAWETWVSAGFLRAYFAATRHADLLPSDSDDLEVLLSAFTVDKALYELGYELNNRPDWVHVPLTGLLRLRSLLHA